MLKRLEAILERYEELTRLISDPRSMSDQAAWRERVKEHARLEELVQKGEEVRGALADLETAREMLAEERDQSQRQWIVEETERLTERSEVLQLELKRLLLPRDPRDEKDVIIEIRAGAGGEEAALFASNLYRMYVRYAERKSWKTEVLSLSETDIGGFKEIIFNINGRGVYSRLKFESGVHRVQRVPATEGSGRIHTSTITVAVLPEAEEVDVDISPDEIQVDTYRASGAGGQHVNKTESAIRITHLPTRMVVTCQDERSQHKNRVRAMKILRARLLELAHQERESSISAERRAQVGSAGRSEKIRTYNFPQTRVTDHRVGLTLHRLEMVMDGDLDEIVDAATTHFEAAALARAE